MSVTRIDYAMRRLAASYGRGAVAGFLALALAGVAYLVALVGVYVGHAAVTLAAHAAGFGLPGDVPRWLVLAVAAVVWLPLVGSRLEPKKAGGQRGERAER